MPTEELQYFVQTIHSAIDRPYPATVSAPLDTTAFDPLTNFLRNGPARKVFLVNCSGGDYEYDEAMTPAEEARMETENDECFNNLLKAATDVWGEARGEFPPAGMAISETNYADNSHEGQQFDGVEWTPEYAGGALFRNADSLAARYWQQERDVIFTQKGKWTGDGNFLLFVLVTVTPLPVE
ncbi:MAG: hypothetical protein EOO01_40325 [Chitinophagaceae bacterium]|nr:MAG: hypothetical protein EOO01_40325 [Chitinophagaceae bacterium]